MHRVLNKEKNKLHEVSFNEEIKKEISHLIYHPLNTIRECNRWGQDVLKINHVDYSEFNLEFANRINRQLQIMFNLYPEINTVRWIGDFENSAAEYYCNSEILRESLDLHGKDFEDYMQKIMEYMALVIDEDCKYKGIWFNNREFKNSKELESYYRTNIKDRYSSISTAGIERDVTHEFAHHIEEFLICKNSFNFMDKIWKEQQNRIKSKKKRTIKACRTITKALCRYGSENISEFFAEGMSEYIHNPHPRPLAKRIGEETRSAFNILRLQRI